MKQIKIFQSLIFFIIFLVASGCTNFYDDIESSISSEKDKIATTRSSNSLDDTIQMGEIIPIQDSPYKRIDQKARYSSENNSFFDIREMDVNIMVRENTHSKRRFLSSNGVQKEIGLSETADNDKQKFKLYIMPLTSYIYIKDYQGHLVSMGVYSNDPETRILYVKEGDSTTGACWDFYKGVQREYSNILENADALEQGPGGWMYTMKYLE